MNFIKNLLITLLLTGTLVVQGVAQIDTDRRVIPVVETLKIFAADMRAQNAAEQAGVFDSVVIVYNNGSHGTGFFISETQLLTNHHMVAKRNQFGGRSLDTHDHVTIQTREGKQMVAKVLKADADLDVALLELTSGQSKHWLELADTESEDGAFVYIAGNGGFDFFWAKGGYLTGKYKFNSLWNNTQRTVKMRSKGGFSGSPVIDNSTGRVVGVHAGGAPSLSLAIHVPITDVKNFLLQPNDTEAALTLEAPDTKTEWPDLIILPNRTHNFLAHYSYMQGLDTKEIAEYLAHFNIHFMDTGVGIKFFGPSQPGQHLLMHIYFGTPLKVAAEERVITTKLYIYTKALRPEHIEPLKKFVNKHGVKVQHHKPSKRIIFTGKKVHLIAILNFVIRGEPLE